MTQNSSQTIGTSLDTGFDSLTELEQLLSGNFVAANQIAEIELDDGSTLYLSRNKSKTVLHDDTLAYGMIPFASVEDCINYMASRYDRQSFLNAKLWITDQENPREKKAHREKLIITTTPHSPATRQPLSMINHYYMCNQEQSFQRLVQKAFHLSEPNHSQDWEVKHTGNHFRFMNTQMPLAAEQFSLSKIDDRYHLMGDSYPIGKMAMALKKMAVVGQGFQLALHAQNSQGAIDFTLGLAKGGVDVEGVKYFINEKAVKFDQLFPKHSEQREALEKAREQNKRHGMQK